ncbi:MAG: metallophosphoesterase family protein [Solirubrobacterales bacterium]
MKAARCLCAALSFIAVTAVAGAPAGAASSTAGASQKMLSGAGKSRNTTMKTLKLGDGRVAYLRFHVPSSWAGSDVLLNLDPNGDSAGISARKVSASWEDGEAGDVSYYKTVSAIDGPALLSSVDSGIDMSSQLAAGKTYTLKLSARSGTVRTSAIPVLARSTPSPVAAVGDISCPASSSQWNGGQGTATRCGQASVAALVRSADEKVLLLGDNQYSSGTLSDYQGGFALSWGGLASRLRPVPGNHEYYTADAAGYFDYFASVGVTTGDRGAGWYAYDSGNWRILALNSNDECKVVACGSGSAQEQWLRSELTTARAAGKCTLAYWHHPRASGGSHGDQSSVASLWQAMYELGGDVVLSGHDHHYQRFDPLDAGAQPAADGPRQWVVGTGGYSFYPAVARAGSAKVITDTFGLLRLTLSGDSYEWEWAGVAGAGSDTGSASCRA